MTALRVSLLLTFVLLPTPFVNTETSQKQLDQSLVRKT